MFRKGFDMPHCSSFCWSTSGGLSTFLKTRMLIICETYKTGINAHEKHSSLSRLQFTLLMDCDVILFFFFAVWKTLLIGYSCQTNVWMRQVLGTVYIWADTICECEYKLCTYINANLCFISMQTCDDFTALHLQRELFSHTWSLENVGMMSSFLSQMPHSTGESSCPDSSHFWKYSGLSEGASCTVSSF